MSGTPRIRRILLPPPIPHHVVMNTSHSTALAGRRSQADLTASTPRMPPAPPATTTTKGGQQQQQQQQQQQPYFHHTLQTHVRVHPHQPLVAFVLVDDGTQSSTTTAAAAAAAAAAALSSSSLHKLLVVQNTQTRQVVWQCSFIDLAAAVFNESDIKKIPGAVKSLGTILSLAFWDPSILYWNGMYNRSSGGATTTTTTTRRWQALIVQTSQRIMVLNLRVAPEMVWPTLVPGNSSSSSSGGNNNHHHPALVLAHLSESTLGSTPSSNLLGLSPNWFLLGCADGSLKCYDWRAKKTFKSIKGLGKGDWMEQLHAANWYGVSVAAGSSGGPIPPTRRMLTVTKKGIAYLIELTYTATTLEIQPPLARFIVAEASTGHQIQYDAHRDWLTWLQVNPKSGAATYRIWNWQALQSDFVKQDTSSSSGPADAATKNLFTPDATLTVTLSLQVGAGPGTGIGGDAPQPFGVLPQPQLSSSASTAFSTQLFVSSGLVWPGMAEETFAFATVSNTGDLLIQGAQALPKNVKSTTAATPLLGVNLAPLLIREAGLDIEDNMLSIQVHAIQAQPLGPSLQELIVATNLGLIVVELETQLPTGSRHVHFGASLGSLGKSILQMNRSDVIYGSVDTLKQNPVGRMDAKNLVTLQECPAPLHLPSDLSKRPFRLAPLFLVSPSGQYACLLWPAEFRYEIFHLSTLLQKVGKSSVVSRSAMVASGTGVADFCWVGDDDHYALLHAPDWPDVILEHVPQFQQLSGDEGYGGGVTIGRMTLSTPGLDKIRSGGRKMANLTATATSTTLSVARGAASAATSMAVDATKKTITKSTDVLHKGVKVFGLFNLAKKKKGKDGESTFTADDDESESHEVVNTAAIMSQLAAAQEGMAAGANAAGAAAADGDKKSKRHYVELRKLVAMDSQASELSGGSTAAATSSSLGELRVRGSNRSPPMAVFGGPVICVASRVNEDDEGHAHFYTRKRKDDKTSGGGGPTDDDDRASTYASSGPTLPYPDLLAWDDDGRLCAVVVHSRVAVYVLNEPEFVLLGTVRIGSPSLPTGKVTSVKFISNVLYCCTINSCYCVFMGELDSRSGAVSGRGICYLDTFLLSTTDVASMPDRLADDSSQYPGSASSGGSQHISFSWTVSPAYLPLVYPVVLGYQGGSLLVSSLRGIYAVPLTHPVLRIGILLASGQVDRAVKWFDAVPDTHHEALSAFLERRGYMELAVGLPGLSLETVLDISMRYGLVERLEEAVEAYGVRGISQLDMGRGMSSANTFLVGGLDSYSANNSLVVCVGAYLLAYGKIELVRQMATECLGLGEEGVKDAFLLGALMLPVNESDASRLIHRAVVEHVDSMDNWVIGRHVRDFLLSKERT